MQQHPQDSAPSMAYGVTDCLLFKVWVPIWQIEKQAPFSDGEVTMASPNDPNAGGARAVWPPGCAPPAHERIVPIESCTPKTFLFSRHSEDVDVEACALESRASRASLKAAAAGGIAPITPHDLCKSALGGEAAVLRARRDHVVHTTHVGA